MTSIAILRAQCHKSGSLEHYAGSEIPRDLLDRIEAMWKHVVASDANEHTRTLFRGRHVLEKFCYGKHPVGVAQMVSWIEASGWRLAHVTTAVINVGGTSSHYSEIYVFRRE